MNYKMNNSERGCGILSYAYDLVTILRNPQQLLLAAQDTYRNKPVNKIHRQGRISWVPVLSRGSNGNLGLLVERKSAIYFSHVATGESFILQ